MTHIMLNAIFDNDIDVNLKNSKPNDILKKCKSIVSTEIDGCVYKRNSPDSPYLSTDGYITINLIFKVKENEGTLVIKQKIREKLYEKFNRDNITEIKFHKLDD